jgi:hypothetical protein
MRSPAPGVALHWRAGPLRRRRAALCQAARWPIVNSESAHQSRCRTAGPQDLPRIGAAIAGGSSHDAAIARLYQPARKGAAAAHLMGLLSPGSVHSHHTRSAALADPREAGTPVASALSTGGPRRQGRGIVSTENFDADVPP